MENKTEAKDSKKAAQDIEVMRADSSKDNSKTMLIWLALLSLLCLQAGFYWLWLQQSSQNEALNQQLAVVQQASQHNISSQELIAKNQSLLTTLEQDQQEMAMRVQVLSESQQLSIGDVKQYWALAEVEYLLNVANQRVVLANDIAGAQSALEMADKRIEALSDYRLHPLRALLAEEQLALAAVTKLDIEGMGLQLKSALDNVENLQILTGPTIASEQQETIASNPDTFQGVLDQAWQEVKSLVVIRHQEGSAAAVLVPEQQYFLYQNLRLKLESAQLALLSGEQVMYEQSLNSAAQWLQKYFIGEDRDAILQVVTSLQSVQIIVEQPDISASLTWLQQQGEQ
ncbi:MAG: uroporphyrinogen-III C-methyltransferase [Piscirickettsiaceae bacterium]|nr:uroporphyrinogen-III C-methyltransferase [Piscirickettsiaceae bacterium]